MDPVSLYQSFLQSLRSQSSESTEDLSSIIYSSTTNSASYNSVLRSYIRNKRFDTTSTPKPSLIITPTTESQVQTVILCAKKLGVQIKIRSGGHDFEGISYISSEPNFIILDMFNFHDINVDIDHETAVVGAGAQLGELYYKIWEKSDVHGFPAGVCPTVGVGGHLSGGGYGTMLRKYGLSIDHVIDARIVDAKGRILDRNAMGEDLFWAIRGGGGASFGVILSYTVKLVKVPKIHTVFRLKKTVDENAAQLVYKWQMFMRDVDDDLFMRALLKPVKVNDQITGRATFIAHFLGDSDRLVALMSEKFPKLGLRKEDCLEVSWIQSIFFWHSLDYNTLKPDILFDRQAENDHDNFRLRKSDFIKDPIPESGVTDIFNKIVELGQTSMALNSIGGRMNEIPVDATPFPHRVGTLFLIQYYVSWNAPDLEMEINYQKQIRALYDFMTQYVSKDPRGAFMNYRDLDIGVMTGNSSYTEAEVYGLRYFKGNFERLVKVKTDVDPDNFFRNEQSIPTRKTAKGNIDDANN